MKLLCFMAIMSWCFGVWVVVDVVIGGFVVVCGDVEPGNESNIYYL